jgi:tRNA(His) 5'-end guanylyltransferase
MESLGDRIKGYERVFNHSALKRMPLMIRVDGRDFHTLLKYSPKPFDSVFIKAMIASSLQLAKSMQGFKVAYVQSDEVTFCITDYDTIKTQGWFDYDLSKIISMSAAIMSVEFNHNYRCVHNQVFDSRAFNVPIDDVVNAFLWRAQDWKRNSIQMYAHYFFSDKELYGKNQSDMHEMLHQIGSNWATDLTDLEKNGAFIILKGREYNIRTDILPTYESIDVAIGKLFISN